MPELKSALGTDVSMTVIRKLRALSYLTSYSHGGQYYTLPCIPAFDEDGLWSYQSVLFSAHGNLQETVKVFVDDAKVGYTSSELKSRLGIETKEALLIKILPPPFQGLNGDTQQLLQPGGAVSLSPSLA